MLVGDKIDLEVGESSPGTDIMRHVAGYCVAIDMTDRELQTVAKQKGGFVMVNPFIANCCVTGQWHYVQRSKRPHLVVPVRCVTSIALSQLLVGLGLSRKDLTPSCLSASHLPRRQTLAPTNGAILSSGWKSMVSPGSDVAQDI